MIILLSTFCEGFVTFRVLFLYNFELKQNIPVTNRKTQLVAVLKITICMCSCTLTQMCIIVKSNHQNGMIVLMVQQTLFFIDSHYSSLHD